MNQQKAGKTPTADTASVTPRATDYAQWYLDVIKRADLAEHSPVRGCMVIKPHGYAIWEKMQRELDDRFKATGHVNAYFPLLHSAVLPHQGRGTRRRLRQGMRRCHPSPPQIHRRRGGR